MFTNKDIKHNHKTHNKQIIKWSAHILERLVWKTLEQLHHCRLLLILFVSATATHWARLKRFFGQNQKFYHTVVTFRLTSLTKIKLHSKSVPSSIWSAWLNFLVLPDQPNWPGQVRLKLGLHLQCLIMAGRVPADKIFWAPEGNTISSLWCQVGVLPGRKLPENWNRGLPRQGKIHL